MELLEAVMGRRSINFFDPARGVEEDQLRELLELANLAPSSVNLQPWRVIVAKSAEKKKNKAFSIGEEKIVPLLIGVGYLKHGTKLLPRALRRRLDDFVKFA
ncbi:MAG TPA: hypothetical protein DCL44_11670 [Elusimicrobia bacterium]|nr:hypothetical protein [Elusimicrobiota bacterium]